MQDQRGFIYLVEHDFAVRDSLRFALETEGLLVQEFPDAASLLAQSRFEPHSCLVLAGELNDVNSIALVRMLRKRGVSIPAILLATFPGRNLIAESRKLNVYIAECPFVADDLIDAILATLDSTRSN